jgi:hypothetical protein
MSNALVEFCYCHVLSGAVRNGHVARPEYDRFGSPRAEVSGFGSESDGGGLFLR